MIYDHKSVPQGISLDKAAPHWLLRILDIQDGTHSIFPEKVKFFTPVLLCNPKNCNTCKRSIPYILKAGSSERHPVLRLSQKFTLHLHQYSESDVFSI